jgi:hypothetical protein
MSSSEISKKINELMEILKNFDWMLKNFDKFDKMGVGRKDLEKYKEVVYNRIMRLVLHEIKS